MRYKDKKRSIELLLVIGQALESLKASFNQMVLGEIHNSLKLILGVLEQEKYLPRATMGFIQELIELLRDDSASDLITNGAAEVLYGKVLTSFDQEVEGRIKVAFFPYKASMWDSLESIYFAAAKDPMCDVSVVPIPYYTLTESGAESHYEGGLFPSNVPITHYSTYDLKAERPDIIYVHNIYDQFNVITRVHEEYFTTNLKKYTDLLVYVPYCLVSFRRPKLEDASTRILFCLPSFGNVDKVVVQGKYYRDMAVKLGIPREKILALGSPKIDRLVAAYNGGFSLPRHWEDKIKGKTVLLFDTHMLFFSSGNAFEKLEMIVKILNTPNFVDNSVLIWRPHPLLLSTLKRVSPLLADYYTDLVERMGKKEYSNVIFDDSPDFLPALVAADVYIGKSSSLLNAFLLKGKPIVLISGFRPESLVKNGMFHSLVEPSSSWISVLRDAAEKSKTKDHQKVMLAQDAWYNVDGTSGDKIYRSTRNLILHTQN